MARGGRPGRLRVGHVAGLRTRRYHALLLAARRRPPAASRSSTASTRGVDHRGRALRALVATLRARRASTRRRAASTYFAAEPWPPGRFALEDGTRLEHELFVPRGIRRRASCLARSWPARGAASLEVRPLPVRARLPRACTTRTALPVRPRVDAGEARSRSGPTRPSPAMPSLANGDLRARAPSGTATSSTREERARGLDHVEDLASPGMFRFDLGEGEAVLVFWPTTAGTRILRRTRRAAAVASSCAAAEASAARRFSRRGSSARPTPTWCAAARAAPSSPAIPGSPTGAATPSSPCAGCASPPAGSTRRATILVEWAGAVSRGHAAQPLPRPAARTPEFNSVDASLWYVVAAHEFLRGRADAGDAARPASAERCSRRSRRSSTATRGAPATASGWTTDGLLAAGEPGVQLTWMDAKVGDRVVTPRIGKPVEVQALWLNALRIGARASRLAGEASDRGRRDRFASALLERRAPSALLRRGRRGPRRARSIRASAPTRSSRSAACRFAAARGRPGARASWTPVERELLTPLGLRSLAPGRARLRRRATRAASRERDGAYHQGTVWPWLLGPFVEAWVRVRGGTPEAQARGARAVPRAAAAPPRRGRPRARLRDRRRRRAARPARLSVPGLVGGRAAAPRPRRPRERRSFLGHVPKRGDQQAQAARGSGPAPFGALSRAWA